MPLSVSLHPCPPPFGSESPYPSQGTSITPDPTQAETFLSELPYPSQEISITPDSTQAETSLQADPWHEAQDLYNLQGLYKERYLHNQQNTHESSAIYKKLKRRKWLLPSLITLVILIIIGSAGALFLYTRDHATNDQAYPGYLPGHGTLAFSDPLSQERGSQWRSSSLNSSGGACQFVGGAYHVSRQPNAAYSLCGAHRRFSNFALEVQLTITQGDCGGMMFRNDSRWNYYKFTICQNGGYRLYKFVVNKDSTLLSTGWSSAIHTGLGRQNTIAVVASGSTMTFYANEQQIAQAQDSSYASGLIWFTADPTPRNATDIAYRNARLWTL